MSEQQRIVFETIADNTKVYIADCHHPYSNLQRDGV